MPHHGVFMGHSTHLKYDIVIANFLLVMTVKEF